MMVRAANAIRFHKFNSVYLVVHESTVYAQAVKHLRFSKRRMTLLLSVVNTPTHVVPPNPDPNKNKRKGITSTEYISI